jgi:hypothetical protein
LAVPRAAAPKGALADEEPMEPPWQPRGVHMASSGEPPLRLFRKGPVPFLTGAERASELVRKQRGDAQNFIINQPYSLHRPAKARASSLASSEARVRL